MQNLQTIHSKLQEYCPKGYRINEIIPFGFPYRRIKVKATVNKSPEKSLCQIYVGVLDAIRLGFDTDETVCASLGLSEHDFLLKELYTLKELGYLSKFGDKWLLTNIGHEYLRNTSILRVLVSEEYTFLINGISGELTSYNPKKQLEHEQSIKTLELSISYEPKSPKLVEDKLAEISDLFKKEYQNQAFIVDIDAKNILFDKKEFQDYALVEYVAEKGRSELEPFVEVRILDNDFRKADTLTHIAKDTYPEIIYKLSDSERVILPSLEEGVRERFVKSTNDVQKIHTLSIWETQAAMQDALKTAKHKLLIESPWIKKAASKYLNDITNLLKKGVAVYILYGIKGNDEHDYSTLRSFENLSQQYKNFHLIHLPTHFQVKRLNKLGGTHRKLLIKDNELYISGSFNFLSFNKKEGEKVANEESHLIKESQAVTKKWHSLFKEYYLS